jgi:hypothetical protein
VLHRRCSFHTAPQEAGLEYATDLDQYPGAPDHRYPAGLIGRFGAWAATVIVPTRDCPDVVPCRDRARTIQQRWKRAGDAYQLAIAVGPNDLDIKPGSVRPHRNHADRSTVN